MAIQANTTVKGAVINNAYIKITRLNISGNKPKTGSGTAWSGSVVVGIFANKALADASAQNAIDVQVVQIPNALTLPAGNVVASVYTYLLTLPAYAGAVSV